MIHCPRDRTNRVDQWRALEEAQRAGKLRSIGVSDYEVAQLQEIEDAGLSCPSVLQIEISPWLMALRKRELEWCKARSMYIEAWGLMGTNKKDDDPTVKAIAAKYQGRTVPDVLLKFAVMQGFIALTTSRNPAHQQTNLEVVSDASWQLDAEDLAKLAELSTKPFHTISGMNLSGSV